MSGPNPYQQSWAGRPGAEPGGRPGGQPAGWTGGPPALPGAGRIGGTAGRPGPVDRWRAAPVRLRVLVAAGAWFLVVAVPVALQNIVRAVQSGEPTLLAPGPIGRLDYLVYGGGGVVAPVLASVLAAALVGRLLPTLAAVAPPLLVVSVWSLLGAAVAHLDPVRVLGGVALAVVCAGGAAVLAGAAVDVDVLRPAVVAVGLRSLVVALGASLSAPILFLGDPIAVFRVLGWVSVLVEGLLLAGLLVVVVRRHAAPWLRVGLAVAATLVVGPLLALGFQLVGLAVSALDDTEPSYPVSVSTLLRAGVGPGRLVTLVVVSAVGVGVGLLLRGSGARTTPPPPAGPWPPAGPSAGQRV